MSEEPGLAGLPPGPLAVLVNGLPGAGKTTLARTLAPRLGLPLVSKDMIKETHADALGAGLPGWPPRRWQAALGAAAGETMWTLLAASPIGAVLESWWPTDVHEFVVRGLRRAKVFRTVELWCDVPLATARRRYEARHPRHPIHGDLPTDDQWERWRHAARPVRVGPTLHVDTTGPIDTQAVIAWIQEPERHGHLRDGHADHG